MSKIRIGILGAFRGRSMIKYCKEADNAEIVAICDKYLDALEEQKKAFGGTNVAFYDNFDEFINHEMDAVVLANYATEHAPFAIKALSRGLHVFSEVLPVQTMQEAVLLVEAVEKSGKIYAYGENYCYMPATYEMKKLYREGKIGEFEYGEGEYIHNCESIWHTITYGDASHWRNNMYSTFYCTHSIGPIIHATGLRPVSVIGFEGNKTERNLRMGAKGGAFGIEMITLENDGIIKSIHGGLYEESIWYTMYGSKGRMESARYDTKMGNTGRIYVKADEYSGQYSDNKPYDYAPEREHDEKAKGFGHGNSDFYCMWNFVEKIKGNPEADTIDVYEALDMFLPGMFAYRSILNDGKKMEIPNLRNKDEREKWRNDTACTDPKVAKDMLLPTSSRGTPVIEDEIYELVKKRYEAEKEKNKNK